MYKVPNTNQARYISWNELLIDIQTKKLNMNRNLVNTTS
jgi:hypothetical protein